MFTKAQLDELLAQPALAVVGVSRGGTKFGNLLYRTLRERGTRVYAVHPRAAQLEGDPAYAAFNALPEPVGGVVVCVKPAQVEAVLREAVAAGIPRVWLQQGSASREALAYAAAQGLTVLSGACLLMHIAGDRFPHKFHRAIDGWLGRLPR